MSTGFALIGTSIGITPSGDPSGATDYAAIQEAVNAVAASGGGPVYLAPGTFTTQPLTTTSNVVLEGAGSGATTVQLAPGQNTHLIQSAGFGALTGTDTASSPYGIQLRGLTLDGNKTAQSAGSGNCLSLYAYGCVLEDVIARNARGVGIWSEWGSASAFLAPNGMESFAAHLKVHDCDSGSLTWIGPHDSQISDVILVQNSGYTPGRVALAVPTDGRANGSIFRGIHVYGGAYDHGALAGSAGVTFEGCQFEGALLAQMKITASQVLATDCRWFWGSSGANSTKGIILGDATHTNLNGLRLTGKVENCSGGVIDLTYATGGSNAYQLLGVYVAPFTVPSPAVISAPGANDTATITVTNNSGVATADSQLQTPGAARVGSLSISGVTIPAATDTDPLGYGYATTCPQPSGANGAAAGTANFAYYQQLIGYGMTAAGLRIYVGASSGNISVGAYTNGGQAGANRLPQAQQATSGAVPCPAIGQATVNFGAPTAIGRSWYAALSVDNGTATFFRAAPQSTISNGVAANQGSAHPLPSTASAANGGGTVMWMATP